MRLFRYAVVLALFAVVALSPPAVQAKAKRPPAVPTATGTGGAAASVDPYATQAAIRVMRHGGNAIDAAVAAAAMLGVVEPYSSGIGGGGFMVIRTASGEVVTIDGRETAPMAFAPDSFLEGGEPIPFPERVTSGLGVGVPGTVRTWELALDRYGTVPLRKLMQPAIRVAQAGFVVDPTFEAQTRANEARFRDFTSTSEVYLPGGEVPEAGSVIRNRDMAKTYRAIAQRGGDVFYTGAIARDIVETVKDPPLREGATRNVRPGLMETSDLAGYEAKWRPPTSVDYRGFQVLGMGPPSSGGSTIGEALNIIEALGATSDATTLFHRYIEALKLAFADRGRYLGDSDFVNVPLECLLSQAFADERATLISDDAVLSTPQPAGDCGPAAEPAGDAEGLSTTHLTVADAAGNVVSYTFTIEQTGGSGIVVPDRGFLLNNELTDFEPQTGLANSPAPGKRPRSSMSPTIVLRDGAPFLAVGSPGGATIITTVLQILIDRIDRGMTLPEAIADPRASSRNGSRVDAEPAFISSAIGQALAAEGHVFNSVAEIGAATGIELLGDGRFLAAAEPERRGGGSAMVVGERGKSADRRADGDRRGKGRSGRG